ncbi:MAG: TM0106 family RecB-like putative nuclease [Microcella sp.]|uniref:TM0106 family RecB-like putative nuclease n=1 Tax=Microcella sp. TaxID=1913979 RepID=UPI002715D6E6|nr:bifunctional RecB family nuclease/DEAD/DEAH box helicase [Microcella sp.]MDO8336846.1 TM0106 family RecB-like putative nuclease [Microcella sp.]
MFLLPRPDGGRMLVTSASDLTSAAGCEFGFGRTVDALLGRIAKVEEATDAMMQRTIEMGHAHEARLVDRYRQSGTLVDIPRADAMSAEAYLERQTETVAALRARTDMVTQGTFFDPEHGPELDDRTGLAFIGFADFLEHRGDGVYRVLDSKLARKAKVTALLQLAAYADQLQRLGVPVDDETGLILGTGATSIHRLVDIAPVHRRQRARMHALLRERVGADAVLPWRDNGVAHCGKCAWCEAAIVEHDDVWQVAGLRGQQWSRLGAAGITTVRELADSTGPIDGMPARTLEGLRLQARLQAAAAAQGAGAPPPVELVDAAALAALPPPSAGDLYFDFEGDPLYTEGDPARWGIDYLFGMVDANDVFTPYWAHTFADERDALIAFLDDVQQRRAEHPDLHIYHYAAYERTHLRQLAARHGVGEQIVDELLRDGVLVDLYTVVKRAFRIGSASYSIKKLEPLYWPESREGAAVAAGGDSVAEYVRARELRENGQEAEAQAIIDDIAEYNRVDCVSTRKLADWLRAYPRGGGGEGDGPGGDGEGPESDDPGDGGDGSTLDDAPPEREIEASPLHDDLIALAARPDGTHGVEPDRTPEERLYHYAAAAIDYHRREHKTFWWEHFDRLASSLDEWADTRDVFLVDPDGAHTQTDWGKTGKQRSLRRHVRLVGEWAPGSRVSVSTRTGPFAVYEHPAPLPLNRRDPRSRPARGIALTGADDDSVVITETLATDPATGQPVDPYADVPIALIPGPPPDPGKQKPAIEEWGAALVTAAPALPRDAVVDLLLRRPPVTASGGPLAAVEDDADGEPDRISAVVASLLDLDDSYLAVQGPPGTGKTYLGSRVVARLAADHGWRIGVVAQGHATVEHMLDTVVAAGLPPAQVAKAARAGDDHAESTALRRYTVLPNGTKSLGAYAAGQTSGYVIGGTAWDFSDPGRVGRRELDLLVVDEAGQYSLAATIAASMSARRLLLLGDPQQLPQVSQGTHPEPIDGSALGYLSDGHDVLPPELGYFLAETRRVHPALAAVVSDLSYEGRLHAHPAASRRYLDGVPPGLHPVPVEHSGNDTESTEEAAAVVDLIDRLIGTAWSPDDHETPAGRSRPLEARDVIVVTPYNAQVHTLRLALDGAGHHETRVGTVDKFQGQEAAIAIVSLAASNPGDAPRGMEFLLNRNRLNVAISRAQWAAYLVHSPALADHLPHTPAGVAELSAFLRVLDAGR